MKKLFTLIIGLNMLLLGACASSAPPLYARNSYTQLSWDKKSFEEVRAKCRLDHGMYYNAKTKTYEMHRALFKACMEKYGFHYNGPNEIEDKDLVTYHLPFTEDPNAVGKGFPNGVMPAGNSDPKAALYR